MTWVLQDGDNGFALSKVENAEEMHVEDIGAGPSAITSFACAERDSPSLAEHFSVSNQCNLFFLDASCSPNLTVEVFQDTIAPMRAIITASN
jgi:hypothetical protein